MDTSGSAPRERGNEQVQIRELGGPDGSGAGYSAEPENDDAAPGRRPSRPFLPAWLLTGAMLAVGLLWLAGAFESVMYGSYAGGMYSDGNVASEQPPLAVQLRNLAHMAQLLLLLGTLSAAALLIVQGALKSGSRPGGEGRG